MKKMKKWKLITLLFISISSFTIGLFANDGLLKVFLEFGCIIPNYIVMVYGFKKFVLKKRKDIIY